MIEIQDWGRMGYADAWARQHSLFDVMTACKKRGCIPDKEYLVIVEHDHVVTMGKHANPENLLFSESAMRDVGVGLYRVERGGDVTYHGPGQLVAYPILDLEQHRLGVKDYVWLLEESVVRTIAFYGIKGERVEGASGVWLGKGTARERKICAVGVKCSRFCTMHGLALNVNTDLSRFNVINPCGFTDKGVTSMQRELGMPLDFEEVKRRFSDVFLSLVFTFKKGLDLLEKL